MDFGRIAAQSAKQVIVQKVRDAERDRQYEEFKDRIGEIVNGQVKRVEYGNVIVDLGRGEGIVRRDELIRARPSATATASAPNLRRPPRAARAADFPVAHASPVHVEAVRPGSAGNLRRHHRSEVGRPRSGQPRQDRGHLARFLDRSGRRPASACAAAASRPSSNELQGEKIDIIPWSADAATFIVNSLQPAEVAKVVLDEDAERIEVVVPDEQLSLAIGRRGQNVRLASQLTGWDIDILTEQEESERRQKEFLERSQLFVAALDVDEVVRSVARFGGFCVGRRDCLRRRRGSRRDRGFRRGNRGRIADPRPGIPRQSWRPSRDAERKALGVEDGLKEVPGITTAILVALGKAGIKTVEDFAGSVPDELTGWVERKDGEQTRHGGALDSFQLSRADAESDDHAGARQGGLDHRGRSEPAGARSRRCRRRRRNDRTPAL